MSGTFPRRWAATQGFTRGVPRTVRVSPDGQRVLFLRSSHGEDPVNRLWVLDGDGERLLADPADLVVDGSDLPAEERRRRERLRESGGGIVAYAGDRDLRMVAFVLGGQLHVVDATGDERPRHVDTAPRVFDPRPDPGGTRIAYVSGGTLRVRDVDGDDREIAAEDGVSWGLAEFVAAEEMGRTRGHWWGPDGDRLAVARVDEREVPRWHIADPVDPATEPAAVAYPAAGAANAAVTLWICGPDGRRHQVEWDRDRHPYLARVRWGRGTPLTLLVQSRDQRSTRVLGVDPDSGRTGILREDRDDAWVDLVVGSPDLLEDGRLVSTIDRDDTRRLAIDGDPVTPAGLQVSAILDVAGDSVLLQASDEPTSAHVWRWSAGSLEQLTRGPGRHAAAAGGDVLVLRSSGPGDPAVRVTVRAPGRDDVPIASNAADPGFVPRPRMLRLGERDLRGALLLPADHEGPLPVLLWPYGGPGAQRVVASARAYLRQQWLADQGFAVLVIDGRGTPGRGPGWDRSIHLDVAGPVLDDQVHGLHAAADQHPELDLGRVGILGWSFGGYLATLAVLRRPDVFHAAVAGAPVTDWRLYDTHYTERYLGHPDDQPEAYARTSLLDEAHALERPLLLIHGMTDDNVVVAHTLRLSRALLEAGRPHRVLPLSGVTHMTPQEVVSENLLRLQVRFLRRALGGGSG